MILLTNGCSHSVPVQNVKNTSWPYFISKKLGIKNYYGSHFHDFDFFNNREFYLDTILKIDDNNFTIDLSSSSKSNDYIFFETFEIIQRLIQDEKKPDYVFIQWSGPSRRIGINLENNFIFPITPHDMIDNMAIPIFEPLASEITIRYVQILSNYLKSENIKYKFLFYFPINDLSNSKKIIFDKSNLIKYPEGLMDTIKSKNLSWDVDGHPDVKGHDYISNLFLKEINIKNDTII